jgi:Secretion system C-terminal sorting domain
MKTLNKSDYLRIGIIPLMLFSLYVSGQTITKNTASQIANTVCPGSTSYSASIPSNIGACKIKWTVTNGSINGADNQPDVSVNWSDTPGATAIIKVTFSGCESGNPNEGKSDSKSELILSVKDQAWGAYTSTVNIDYCTRAQVNLFVPHMYVQGTGGIAQPPQQEVVYSWTLPTGWREVGTNRTGNFGTFINAIAIEPSGCSLPGTVSVQGIINVPPIACGSAGPSSTATISLNGVSPLATVTVPQGYAGSIACNTAPVTFTALVSPSLGCVNSYSWTYPASWALVSQTSNTVSLRPSGAPADAGTIKATVNFTCGSSVSGIYNVPFINPVLTGPELVCSTVQFTLQNAPAAIANWSVTSYASSNSVSIDQNGFFTRVNSIYNGDATIIASLPCNNTSFYKTIWVGSPMLIGGTASTSYVWFDGTTNPDSWWNNVSPGNHTLSVYRYGKDNNGANTIVNFKNTRKTSSITYAPVYASSSSDVAQYTWFVVKYGDTYTIDISSSNACGSLGWRAVVTSTSNLPPPCNGCRSVTDPDPSPSATSLNLVAYPNPSATFLNVEFEQDSNNNTEEQQHEIEKNAFNTELFNQLGELLKTNQSKRGKISIDISTMPNGLYVLNISRDGELITKKIVIRH